MLAWGSMPPPPLRKAGYTVDHLWVYYAVRQLAVKDIQDLLDTPARHSLDRLNAQASNVW